MTLITEEREFCKTAVSNLFGTRDQFRGRQVFHGPTVAGEGGFWMIQAHYITFIVHFISVIITSTPPQTSDIRSQRLGISALKVMLKLRRKKMSK